jgi:membrane-associated protease RseP (regulator of RpoE activity)
MLWVAAAGPGANLAMALLWALVLKVLVSVGAGAGVPWLLMAKVGISVNLALMVLNLLPVPPLDGGRIAVVLIEAVRRRRLPAEREALIYLTGFAVLLALVILISIKDIQRLIGG